jgi:hypothetical protein
MPLIVNGAQPCRDKKLDKTPPERLTLFVPKHFCMICSDSHSRLPRRVNETVAFRKQSDRQMREKSPLCHARYSMSVRADLFVDFIVSK